MDENILIHQRTANDCGIAALAMLLQIPYSTVHRKMLDLFPAFDGTTYKMARKVCRSFGYTLAVRDTEPNKRWYWAEKFRGYPAVLICPPVDSPNDPDTHAVYWSGNTVLDPSPADGRYKRYGKKGVKAWKNIKHIWFIPDLA